MVRDAEMSDSEQVSASGDSSMRDEITKPRVGYQCRQGDVLLLELRAGEPSRE